MRNFMELLRQKWSEGKFVCVGLDSEFEKIPKSIRMPLSPGPSIFEFNKAIIETTSDLACAYKPNIAFYEAHGADGMLALRHIISRIQNDTMVPVILDFKRGDIGNTNSGYIKAAFEYFNADAVTVNPYLGAEALKPFLEMKDKGIIVLCRTSNSGAEEFRGLSVGIPREELEYFQVQHGVTWTDSSDRGPVTSLSNHVAYRVSQHWNTNGNCAVVVGATSPHELAEIRAIVGDMPILIPGIGAQGGDVEQTVTAGQDSRGQGMIINSSRGIIFASSGEDFAEAARRETLKLHELINKFRKVG